MALASWHHKTSAESHQASWLAWARTRVDALEERAVSEPLSADALWFVRMRRELAPNESP